MIWKEYRVGRARLYTLVMDRDFLEYQTCIFTS